MTWVREFSREIRWTVVVLVLAAVGVVALWPREDGEDSSPAESGPPSAAEPARPTSPDAPVSPNQRAAADLEACARGANGSAELNGASGTCMADGDPADLGSMVGSKPTLINVWATWCAPCRTELPVLADYQRQQDDVSVVGVQSQSKEDEGLDMLRQLGVRFPNVHDREDQIRSALHVPNVLPASYLVTEDGSVHRMDVTVFHSVDEVRKAVDRARGQ